jgi:hypothetical protein
MSWPDDYEDLTRLLVQAARQFQQETGRTSGELDFEYKRIAPDGQLVVKQIRPVPQASSGAAERRFLAGGSIPLSVYQGEHAEPFGAHRLKSNWTLKATSRWLTPEELSACLYDDAAFEYHDEGRIETMTGSPASWPEAQHELVAEPSERGFEVTDAWTLDHLDNVRRCTLTTAFNAYGPVPDSCPVLFLSDLSYALDAEYAEPVVDWQYPDGVTTTTTDRATLALSPIPDPDDLLQTRKIEDAGITIETTFYWPPYPTGPTAGYTAPLVRWVQTTITGLTAEPFTLTSEYAQTYVPGHHNFVEWFMFEPRLEPGLSEETLEELRAQGVDLIYAATGFVESTILTFDLSGAVAKTENAGTVQ